MSERFMVIPCSALVLRQESKIFLAKRVNTGYQDGKYSLVAGHVDGNESPKDAMIREAKEEIGITISKANMRLVHTSHQICDDASERLNMFFEVYDWDGEIINNEPKKCAELTWFSIDNLPENIVPYIAHVLENIKKDKNYSEYRGSV